MADRNERDVLRTDWGPDDDELLSRALGSLREDVDALPLVDVRFVKARGTWRRRQRAIAWTAATAAAAVVVAALGFSALGDDRAMERPLPAGPSETGPQLADIRSALPVGQEWQRELGVDHTMNTLALKEFDSVDCMPTFPGKPVRAENVGEGADPSGTQAHFATSSAAAGAAAAATIVAGLLDCPGAPFAELTQVSPAAGADTWPRVVAFTAETGDIGWWIVAQHGRDVAYTAVLGAGTVSGATVTQDQVLALADVAQQRLERYGVDGTSPVEPTGTATGAPTNAPTNAPTGGSTEEAIDQDMPVAGPDSTYPSALFVAGSQWASEGLTRGVATEAAEGEYEGSAAVASCDVDTEGSGNFGIVSVRDAGGFIGKQRVRGATSIGDSDQRVTALADGFSSGCTFGNGTVTAKAGPGERTWQLTTSYADGTPDSVEYVAVTPFGESLISTIVITDPPADEGVAFSELDRLVALAVQK